MGRKIWRVFSTVLVVALLAMLAFAFIQRVRGNEISLFGYRMNYIRTGSMETTINTGDVVLCRDISAADVKLNDIITYRNEGNVDIPDGETVCHRVVNEPRTENGTVYLTTKGDNPVTNPAPDKKEVRGDQVIGRYVRTLKVMTLFYKVFLTKWGFLIIIIPLALLLVVELYRIVHSKDADGGDSDNTELTDKMDTTGEADETV